jgi:predicted dehydrogenase
MKLSVGIIGLGEGWESRYRPALRALAERFQVRAVCAQVAARAEQAAQEFGADFIDGYRALAARNDIDAVLILAPEWYGPLPIHAACDAGKAVYCAPTLDLPVQKAALVRRRVRESGVAFMAEFSKRHAAATIRVKELVATCLGEPRLLFCHHRMSVQPVRQTPSSRESAAENRTLLELVDWCRYVVGNEPTSVMGVVHRAARGAESCDYQMMNLDFSPVERAGEAAMAQISCGHYLPSTWTEAVTFRPPAALQVVCERGVAFVDLPSTVVWFDQAGRHLESLEHERPVGEQLLLHFHRAATSAVRKTSQLEDAFRVLAIVQAAQDSAVSGKRVKLQFEAE